MPSPFIAEDIINWINDSGRELVLHAMKIALEQGKATWCYVNMGTERNYFREGTKTE